MPIAYCVLSTVDVRHSTPPSFNTFLTHITADGEKEYFVSKEPKEIIAAFRKIGYKANASVELFRPEYWERDPFELARDAKAAIDELLKE